MSTLTDIQARIAGTATLAPPAEIETQTDETQEPTPVTVEAVEPVEPPVTAPEAVETAQEPSQATQEPDEDQDGTEEARIGRLYAQKRIAEKERDRLAKENEVLRGNRVEEPDEQVDRLANQKAQQIAAENQWQLDQDRIRQAFIKDIGDVEPVLEAFKETFGGTPGELVVAAIAAAPGDEHKVLHWLSKNMDEAERIMKLQPMAQGAAVAKIAARVTAPPPPKPQTKATPPIPRVASGTVEPAAKAPHDMSMAELMAFNQKRLAKSRGWGA